MPYSERVFRPFFASVLVLVALCFAAGCGDDDSFTPPPLLPTATATVPTATRTRTPTVLPGEEGPSVVISSTFPSDIEGGAPNADLQTAAEFAWQEFIALSWPALTTTRDQPDTTKKFGDPTDSQPLVWQTFRHKVEIYPGTGDPPGFDTSAPDFGYGTVPPVYNYAAEVPPCEGQIPPSTPPFVNLDEISQIGLASMFAGVEPDIAGNNSAPQLIRFLAKANEVHYTYVVDPATSYWEQGDDYNTAVSNFTAVSKGLGAVTKLPGTVIDFPAGMVEIKAAFRPLASEETLSGRFYTTRVRYYEPDATGEKACYFEATWGLVGLHIIHKTPTAPSFVFATFEQADNVLTPNGTAVEDTNGTVVNPPSTSTSTTPALSYVDGTPPALNIIGSDFCTDQGMRLFYQDASFFGPISDGDICVNTRNRSIPQTVIDVNEAAHSAIQEYAQENSISNSPWLFYKLVNVQWQPFDKTAVDPQSPDGNRGDPTFHLANIVVETNYTLQNFSGQIAPNGAPTDLPANFPQLTPPPGTFQNVLSFDGDGNLTATVDMGGCMGCHGNAQINGTDFSFILLGGRVMVPEAPTVTEPGTSNPYPRTILEP